MTAPGVAWVAAVPGVDPAPGETPPSVWHHFREVGLENLLVFTLVGAIEACFFLFVASKFVPGKPSSMVHDLLDALGRVTKPLPGTCTWASS